MTNLDANQEMVEVEFSIVPASRLVSLVTGLLIGWVCGMIVGAAVMWGVMR